MGENVADVGVKKQFTDLRPDSIEARSRKEPVENDPKVGELLFFTGWEPALIGDHDVVHEKYLGFLTSAPWKVEDRIYGGEDSFTKISMLADMFAVDLDIWEPAISRSQEFELTTNGGRLNRFEITIPSDENLEEVFRSIKAREKRKNPGGESYLPILLDRIRNRNGDLSLLLNADAVRIERALGKAVS